MKFLFGLILFSILLSCNGNSDTEMKNVTTGIDILEARNFDLLEGKLVGLITNQTGVNSKMRSTIDVLYQAENVDLRVLFGPEHGVRGNYPAGASVRDYRDETTGLMVYSLYGQTRKPTTNMLRDLDVLVFDIQDIGVRSYTYLSTMRLAMEAAAESNLEFVVLDRPNPLGGIRVEGFPAPIETDHFISPWFVPYVHGMTLGEIATMINNEGWLTDSKTVKLTVVPIENWERTTTFNDTGLPWIPTSPHIPQSETAAYYAATGLLGELDVINIGIGYTLPFQMFGAPWISAQIFANRLNAYNMEGISFRPASWKPFYGPHQDNIQHGVQIILDKNTPANLFALQFLMIRTHDLIYPERAILEQASASRLQMFELVSGGGWAKDMLSEFSLSDYEQLEKEKLSDFLELRKQYLMY